MKAAQRISVHPWRDPRLLLGVMLVLLSTVIGAKLFAAQDDTVAYWSLRDSVTAGDPVSRDDLTSTRVRLGSSTGGQYVGVRDEFPVDLRSGDRVDVWVGPGPGEPAQEKSIRVLSTVRVLSTGDESTAVGGSLARTILVAIPEEALAEDRLAGTTLSAISAGHVTLVRVP